MMTFERSAGASKGLVCKVSKIFRTASAGVLLAAAGCVAPMDPSYDMPEVSTPPPPVLPPRTGPELVVTPLPRPTPALPPSVAEPDMGGTYTIQRGDSLSRIAARHGLTTRQLADINQLSNPNKIVIGQKLIIPNTAGVPAPGAGSSKPSSSKASAGANEYTVQKGDVLSRIAVRHGTTVSALKQANNLAHDRIVVGQKLVIPDRSLAPASSSSAPAPRAPVAAPKPVAVPSVSAPAAPALPPAPAVQAVPALPKVPSVSPATFTADEDSSADAVSSEAPMEYTVLSGDTLDEIAKLFIVSKAEIIKLNNLSPDAPLQPGQTIRIPPPDL